MILSVKVLPKIKYFLLRWLHGLLHVADILAKRGLYTYSHCFIFQEGGKSFKHIFGSCIYSTVVWHLYDTNFPLNTMLPLDDIGFCTSLIY